MLAVTADWHPVGRVALLGDAAHATTPDLGQGANQAFEDAAVLARCLAGAQSNEVVARLRDDDARRRPRANRMVRDSARTSRLMSQTGIRARLRDAGLQAVPTRFVTVAQVRMFRGN